MKTEDLVCDVLWSSLYYSHSQRRRKILPDSQRHLFVLVRLHSRCFCTVTWFSLLNATVLYILNFVCKVLMVDAEEQPISHTIS